MSTRQHWDVVVIGGANTDFTVRGEYLPRPGESADGDTFEQVPGGKGANQAVAAARLGARVAFVGKVGSDARGDEILDSLRAEGVSVDGVLRDPKKPTGVALVMIGKDAVRQTLAAPGANRNLSAREVTMIAGPLIRSARVVLLQFEIPLPAVLRAVQLAHKAGAKAVVDPAPAAENVPAEMFRYLDIIRPNAAEARALTGVDVSSRASAGEAAGQLLSKGVRSAAVVAVGSKGNLLLWRDVDRGKLRECWIPRLPVTSIDTTGAGDAFSAALALGIAEERPMPDVAVFASAAAALATTKLGAQKGLADRKTLIGLLRKTGYKAEARALDASR